MQEFRLEKIYRQIAAEKKSLHLGAHMFLELVTLLPCFDSHSDAGDAEIAC